MYLVTGGLDTNHRALTSTELLLPSATSWTSDANADLPYPRSRLRGATINNKVIVTGTNIYCLMTRYVSHLTFYLTNIAIHFIMQVARAAMMYWSSLQRSRNGQMLGPCWRRGRIMQFQSSIITLSRHTVIDDWNLITEQICSFCDFQFLF